MIRMSWLKLASIGLISMAGMARMAHADVVIGDFETTALDGWGTDGGDASFNGDTVHLAQAATGVTLHTHALAATQHGGGFDGVASGNIVTQVGLATLTTATQLSYDETFLSSQIFTSTDPNDPNNPSFAQSNELIWSINGSGGSLGTSTVNLHGQKTVAVAHVTDSSTTVNGNRGTWSGSDHTAHLTWDLSVFTVLDPTDSVIKSYTAILAAHPDATWNLLFQIPLQSGDSTANGDPGPATFFFDNVVLHTVPEPASLGLLALTGLVGLRRRR
ncbi:MAG TPA: PEP-CTERM sorting domain-containing protein [Tepidisphaeraceae bacterium]|nr:PEP-CTERM sorting domain-containing protein [Tepidisphaeraceae bacterium]